MVPIQTAFKYYRWKTIPNSDFKRNADPKCVKSHKTFIFCLHYLWLLEKISNAFITKRLMPCSIFMTYTLFTSIIRNYRQATVISIIITRFNVYKVITKSITNKHQVSHTILPINCGGGVDMRWCNYQFGYEPSPALHTDTTRGQLDKW